MNRPPDKGLVFLFLLFAAFALPVLAFMAWDQALDFDPCDNIFKPGGVKCLTSGAGGIGMGAFVIMLGLAIAAGAVRNGRREYGRWLEPVLIMWLGISMTAVGAAAAYAGWQMS